MSVSEESRTASPAGGSLPVSPSIAAVVCTCAAAAAAFSFALDSLPRTAGWTGFALGSLAGAIVGAGLALPYARRRRATPADAEHPATPRVLAGASVALLIAPFLRHLPLQTRASLLALACTFAFAFALASAVLVRRPDPLRPRRQPAHRRVDIPAARAAPAVAEVLPRAVPVGPSIDPGVLSEAIVVWTGKGGRRPFSAGGDSRLMARFGPVATIDLLPEVRRLHDEFLAFPARSGHTNWQAADAAAEEFRTRYPALSVPALEALRWCYAHEVAVD
ncbi:MAG: hypothetical protein QOH99_1556 [Frankiaceae bacterium]|nr:hypothetical protein [Frankiaceae bacterium]